MPDLLRIILTVFSAVSILSGMLLVFAAPLLVKKKKLDEKKVVDPERIEGLDEEAIRKFKRDSAILDLKVKGVLIALPGAIIILVLFRL